MSRVHVQVWSAPQCEPGAVALGPLTGWASGRVSEADGAPPQLTISGIPEQVAHAASLNEGRLLKVMSPLRGVSWWVVLQVTDRDGSGAAGATLTAGPLRYLLAWRGFVRDGLTYAFTPPPDITPERAVEEYVLNTPAGGSPRPELSADGLTWLSVGFIAYALPISLPPFAWQTRAEVLRAIEQATGGQFVLRPLQPDGATGFALDLLPPPSVVPDVMALLSVPGNVSAAERTRDVMRSPSIVSIRSQDAVPMGVVSARIGGITGTAPAWVRVLSPRGELVREPGQWVGAYLRQNDGSTYEVLDSRVRRLQVGSFTAQLPEVQIADATGLVDNTLAALVRTPTSLPFRAATSPSALAARGRVVGTLSRDEATLDRNWIQPSADFLFDAADVLFGGWTLQGGAEVVEYARAEDISAWSAQADGAYTAGATTITVKSAPPGRTIYGTEVFDFGPGGIKILSSARLTASGGGALTMVLTTGLDAGISDGQAITSRWTLATNQRAPKRPPAAQVPLSGDGQRWLRFRREASSTAMPPAATQRRVQSPTVLVHYQTEEPQYNTIRAAAGFTYTFSDIGTQVLGNLDAGSNITEVVADTVTRNLPGIILLGNPSGTPTRLASAICTTPCTIGSIVNQDIALSHTITADTAVALALIPHSPNSAFNPLAFGVCRWASLWLGNNTTAPVLNGSGGDASMMAALDALEAGTARIRLTGIDLEAVLASGQSVAVGQRIRLRAAGFDTDRPFLVVRCDWSLSDDRLMDADLGAPVPRLTAVTVSV